MAIIKDGGGTGRVARVTENNLLLTKAVTENAIDFATKFGNSYNFNTGAPFDIGSNNSSAVVFFKNGSQDYNIVITGLIYNLGIAAGAATDGSEFANIVAVRGPTAISSGTDVVPVNRNIGSGNLLEGTFQKGAGGATFTGGTDMIETLVASSTPGRIFIDVGEIIIPPSNYFGIRYEAHTSTTQQYVQFATAMYFDRPY